jgi:hypothetical protein
MSKIKLSIIGIFAFFLSTAIFVACNNDVTEQKTESLNVQKVLFAKYKLVKSENSTINIANINSKSKFNTSDKVSEYTIGNSTEKVLVVTSSVKPYNYIVIKGHESGILESKSSENSNFKITKELNIDIQINANGSGSLNVKNLTDNESFSQTLVEGKPTETSASATSSNEAKLCQREDGEGTKKCYLREVDEFCDGFLGLRSINPSICSYFNFRAVFLLTN